VSKHDFDYSCNIPRRAIADPVKLCAAAARKEWSPCSCSGRKFLYMKLDWKRRVGDISEGEYYIVCRDDSMFHVTDLTDWLPRYWQSPFLITTSIYECQGVRWGIVNGKYPHERVRVTAGNELKNLIRRKCYTVCNGLTLALAMHKCKIINSQSLFTFLSSMDTNDLYLRVPTEWDRIYYNHHTQQIADFPWYYVCEGPKQADACLMALLTEDHQEPFTNIIEESTVALTSLQTAMLPSIDTTRPWTNMYLGYPDIYGYLVAVTCNKKLWKWWLDGNKDIILQEWLNTGHARSFIEAATALYIGGHQQLSRSRLKDTWVEFISISRLHMNITVYYIKQMIPTIPYIFMQLLHEKRGGLPAEIMKLMARSAHPYYTKCLVPRILNRLNVIYSAFGLGKRPEPFPQAAIIGSLVLEHLQRKKEIINA